MESQALLPKPSLGHEKYTKSISENCKASLFPTPIERPWEKHPHLRIQVVAGCPTHTQASRTLDVGASQRFLVHTCRLASHWRANSTRPPGPSQDLVAQHDPTGSAWRRPVQPHCPGGDRVSVRFGLCISLIYIIIYTGSCIIYD